MYLSSPPPEAAGLENFETMPRLTRLQFVPDYANIQRW